MKRYFLITTIDGKEYLKEIPPSSQIGEALNSPSNLGQALRLGFTGFVIDEKAAEPVIIAPSQIKSVKLTTKAL